MPARPEPSRATVTPGPLGAAVERWCLEHVPPRRRLAAAPALPCCCPAAGPSVECLRPEHRARAVALAEHADPETALTARRAG